MDAGRPQSPRPRRRARAAALLLGTFIAGAVAGLAPSFLAVPALGTTLGSDGVRLRLSTDLPPAFEELQLTPAQRTAVVQILASARPRTDAVLADVLPQLRAITDSVDAAIRAVLRPDQRERLTRIRGAHGPVLVIRRPTSGGASRVDTITVPQSR
jgi:hypothetical protein